MFLLALSDEGVVVEAAVKLLEAQVIRQAHLHHKVIMGVQEILYQLIIVAVVAVVHLPLALPERHLVMVVLVRLLLSQAHL